MNLPFNSKTQWQMFLLVSGGHVGAHPDGHQHAAFTESALSCSIILGKQFLKFFTCEKSFWPESWRGSFYINLIHFSDSGIYRFIFIFASVTVKTSNKTKRVSGVNLVWNHTRYFKIRWVHRESSIWYHKHDFRPKLHDTKLISYLFITAILKFQDSVSAKI